MKGLGKSAALPPRRTGLSTLWRRGSPRGHSPIEAVRRTRSPALWKEALGGPRSHRRSFPPQVDVERQSASAPIFFRGEHPPNRYVISQTRPRPERRRQMDGLPIIERRVYHTPPMSDSSRASPQPRSHPKAQRPADLQRSPQGLAGIGGQAL